MSRLIERLEKLHERTPAPMGFGAPSRKAPSERSMLIIGETTLTKLSRLTKANKLNLDALVIKIKPGDEDKISSKAKSLEGFIWGASASKFENDIDKLKEAGCDFVVFDSNLTPASVINDPDLGKFLNVSEEINENSASAIHELPIDGTVFNPKSCSPLTMDDIIHIQKIGGMFGKISVVEINETITLEDISAIRETGTHILKLDASGSYISELAEHLDHLPTRRDRKKNKTDIIPQIPSAPSFSSGLEDDGHDH